MHTPPCYKKLKKVEKGHSSVIPYLTFSQALICFLTQTFKTNFKSLHTEKYLDIYNKDMLHINQSDPCGGGP